MKGGVTAEARVLDVAVDSRAGKKQKAAPIVPSRPVGRRARGTPPCELAKIRVILFIKSTRFIRSDRDRPMSATRTRTTAPARIEEVRNLLLRNVPAHVVKALKRAAVELDQPMGRVLAGLVDEFLGLYVIIKRDPDTLTREETEQLRQARAQMARGESVDWERLKRELGIG